MPTSSLPIPAQAGPVDDQPPAAPIPDEYDGVMTGDGDIVWEGSARYLEVTPRGNGFHDVTVEGLTLGEVQVLVEALARVVPAPPAP